MAPNRQSISIPSLIVILLVTAVLVVLSLGIVFVSTNSYALTYLVLPTATLVPTQTPTPFTTPTITPSVTLTPRPTWTLRPANTLTQTPSPTVTQTPEPVFLATLTAALPNRINERNALQVYSAEIADRGAVMLRQLPEIKYPALKDRSQPAFHEMYQPAVFAYQEALLRFSAASQANSWRWGLAFSLAQTGSPDASALYVRLLNELLETPSLRISDLAEAVQQKEPALSLHVHSLPPQPGFLGLYLLEVQPGDMFFWVTETPNSTKIFPLTEQFVFDAPAAPIYLYQDFNADGTPDLAIYRQPANDTRLYHPQFFDLSGPAPLQMALQAAPAYDLKLSFVPELGCKGCGTQNPAVVTLTATVFPACPLEIVRQYAWTGSGLTEQVLRFAAFPSVSTLAQCETIQNLAAAFYPPKANLAVLQAVEPLWPPSLDLKGRLYPADSLDKLRYQIGIYQGLNGDQQAMQATLAALPKGVWQQAAQPFLAAHSSTEIFRACQAEDLCSPARALQAILESLKPATVEEAFSALLNGGAGLASSGIFDFNQDAQPERWFTVKLRPGQMLDFWILVQVSDGVRLLNLGQVESAKPEIYFSVMESSEAIFQIVPRQGYILRFTPGQFDAYLLLVEVDPALTTYTLDNLNAAQQSLFNGVSAAAVRDRLRGVLRSGRFNCKTHQICDRFYYVLGLSYELSGDTFNTIETYLKLWWENKNSPYTTLARLKMILFPTATIDPRITSSVTPSPTSSSTPTITPTPDPNVTPTQTSQPYPLGTYTQTPTPTVTTQSYP